MENKVIHGDCKEQIKLLADNSIDAIVTDPPYELGFMDKKWDASGIAYDVELWSQCLRVLKPGGHLLAFSGTRTYHRMAVAIEDAGFEIRDMLEWVYASGFPKSLNIGKAYDNKMGNEREFVGENPFTKGRKYGQGHNEGYKRDWQFNEDADCKKLTKGKSEWEGQGTALKPAHEPIVMARKPLSEKTIVDNVVKHGTGGIDVYGCRIPTSEEIKFTHTNKTSRSSGIKGNTTNAREGEVWENTLGRFPANILCTDDALNDGVVTKSQKANRKPTKGNEMWGNGSGGTEKSQPEDIGSKSRFFDIDAWGKHHGIYQVPKASSSERNEGCEHLEERPAFDNADGSMGGNIGSKSGLRKNNHPTVKPLHLIAYLVKLVTPMSGMVVLDPFGGSGTTAVACIKVNRKFILIEREAEYIEIINARVKHHSSQLTLF